LFDHDDIAISMMPRLTLAVSPRLRGASTARTHLTFSATTVSDCRPPTVFDQYHVQSSRLARVTGLAGCGGQTPPKWSGWATDGYNNKRITFAPPSKSIC